MALFQFVSGIKSIHKLSMLIFFNSFLVFCYSCRSRHQAYLPLFFYALFDTLKNLVELFNTAFFELISCLSPACRQCHRSTSPPRRITSSLGTGNPWSGRVRASMSRQRGATGSSNTITGRCQGRPNEMRLIFSRKMIGCRL